MKNLADYVKNKEIEFFSRGEEIYPYITDFGEYNRNLARHLAGRSDDYILVKGKGLDKLLYKTENMFEFADFVVEILWKQDDKFKVYIKVNIDNINKYYPRKAEEWLINGFGKKVVNTASWAPNKTQFEKKWHLALCEMEGGRIGYPGYEWPRDVREFEDIIKIHEQNFLIGNKEYLENKIDEHLKKKIQDYKKLKEYVKK